MIAIEQMQRHPMLAGKRHAMRNRHHGITPAMHQQGLQSMWRQLLLGITRQIESRGQQKQAIGFERGTGYRGDMPPMLEPTKTS